MDSTTQAVLDAFELATMSLTFSERMRVLEDSITLYRERGHGEIARALADRLESARKALASTGDGTVPDGGTMWPK
jgi:hypothetical protein